MSVLPTDPLTNPLATFLSHCHKQFFQTGSSFQHPLPCKLLSHPQAKFDAYLIKIIKSRGFLIMFPDLYKWAAISLFIFQLPFLIGGSGMPSPIQSKSLHVEALVCILYITQIPCSINHIFSKLHHQPLFFIVFLFIYLFFWCRPKSLFNIKNKIKQFFLTYIPFCLVTCFLKAGF